MKRLLLATLLLTACATDRHFDAAAGCGPHGVNEWDAYYDASGRLHIEIWCLPRDR